MVTFGDHILTRETPAVTIDGRTYLVCGENGARLVLERRPGRPLALASPGMSATVLAGLDTAALAAAALLMFVAGAVA